MELVLCGIAISMLTIALSVFIFLFIDRRSRIINLERNIKNMSIKCELISTSNKILQSTNYDLKNMMKDDRLKRAILKKQIESLTLKLEENQKKNQAFSKMINDMKNS